LAPANFHLNIGTIKISLVQNSAAVNIGKNLLLDWDSHSKTNQGLGNITGDGNGLEQVANHLQDPDKIDLFSQEAGLGPEMGIQSLLKTFFEEEKNESGD